MGVPVLGIKWEFSCEGVSVNGELVGGPVGTDWSQLWRVFARKGARSVGGTFLMRLWNCGLGSWCGVMGNWECPSFVQKVVRCCLLILDEGSPIFQTLET